MPQKQPPARTARSVAMVIFPFRCFSEAYTPKQAWVLHFLQPSSPGDALSRGIRVIPLFFRHSKVDRSDRATRDRVMTEGGWKRAHLASSPRLSAATAKSLSARRDTADGRGIRTI